MIAHQATSVPANINAAVLREGNDAAIWNFSRLEHGMI